MQPAPPPFAPTMSDAARMAAVAGLAERVAGTLLLAAALAEAGRRLELEGLDRMVGLLCAQALDLPPALGHAFRPRLVGLLEDLDALGRRLAPG